MTNFATRCSRPLWSYLCFGRCFRRQREKWKIAIVCIYKIATKERHVKTSNTIVDTQWPAFFVTAGDSREMQRQLTANVLCVPHLRACSMECPFLWNSRNRFWVEAAIAAIQMRLPVEQFPIKGNTTGILEAILSSGKMCQKPPLDIFVFDQKSLILDIVQSVRLISTQTLCIPQMRTRWLGSKRKKINRQR